MKSSWQEKLSDEEYEALIEKMTRDAKGLALEAWSQADSGTFYLKFANRDFEEGNIKEAIEDCAKAHYFLENRVCRGERKHTGKHPITGELLEWRYIDDIG